MTCPPVDPSSAAPDCSMPDSLWPGSSTPGSASPTSSEGDCSLPVSPEPSSTPTSEPSEVKLLPTPTAHERTHTPRPVDHGAQLANELWALKLLPTPNATLANYEEDPESWRARQTVLKAKGINGNGAGLPLAIAVRELAESTSSRVDFHAEESRAPASRTGLSTPRLFCGTRCGASLGRFDHATFWSRTFGMSCPLLLDQASLLDPSGELYWPTWPRSGSMSSGIVFPLRPSAPRISVNGSSPLLATPMARDGRSDGSQNVPSAAGRGTSLMKDLLLLLPTPKASDDKLRRSPADALRKDPAIETVVWNLPLLPTPHGMAKEGQARRAGLAGNELGHALTTQLAGSQSTGATTGPPSPDGKPSTGLRLNPSFVGWMMGTPSCGECGREWTDPDCPHSATAFMSTVAISSDSPSATTCSTASGAES